MLEVNRNSDTLLYENSGMSIGERVRQARKEAGLTQAALAAKVGIKQPTLSELENGESSGTASIATLAAALGVLPMWLQTGKGPKKPASGTISIQSELSSSDLANLIASFSKCNAEWQKKVLDLAAIGAIQSSQVSEE